MATLVAQITPTGIPAPGYADILAQLRVIFWNLYGSDANLDDDSQDGQWLAVLAKAIDDTNQAAIAAYNGFSPATAQGANLSSMVKLNGIARRAATNSQAIVRVVGEVGIEIVNGLVGDNQSLATQWALPASVIIPVEGQVDVTATCTQVGSTGASIGTLTEILTPTRGWQSVTNEAEATPGEPIETDAALRQRQAISTAQPSLTILEGIYGALAELSGVSRLTVYENDTDIEDAEGVPPHSISAVVEGGDIEEITATIARKKSPGTGTYGTTERTVIDNNGVPNVIHFFALSQVPMAVEVDIKPLPGYLSTTGLELRQAVADFLNTLKIGEDSYLARLYTPANLQATGLGETFVVLAIRQARKPAMPAAANVAIAFNEATTCDLADVALTLVP